MAQTDIFSREEFLLPKDTHNASLLNGDELRLPKNREDDDFVAYVKKILKNYLVVIKVFDGDEALIIKENHQKIESFCNSIIKSIELYYDGFISSSFDVFSEGMALLKEQLFLYKKKTIPTNLFKIRRGKPNPFESKEMFHIPFEKREKCISYRFSISGFPSLYLGNSIYTCLREVGIRNEPWSVSLFSILEKELKLIDISIPTRHLGELFYGTKELGIPLYSFKDYIIAWPLTALCSIKVKNNYEVKPESIIPQHMMQWVRQNEDVEGIVYNSTKFDDDSISTSIDPHLNYVFPVKKISSHGHCQSLKSKIKLTDPVYFDTVVDSSNIHVKNPMPSDPKDFPFPGWNKQAITHNKETLSYRETIYGVLEEKLFNMPLKTLT